MTKLEKLKIVHEYLGEIKGGTFVHTEYWRVGSMIKEIESRSAEEARQSEIWKDRAERAEAALAEAHERAARFEKLLKAEEARKDAGEPVLDKWRLVMTAMDYAQSEAPIEEDNEEKPYCQTWSLYYVARSVLESHGMHHDLFPEPYKWK